jgi:hypothetical protein
MLNTASEKMPTFSAVGPIGGMAVGNQAQIPQPPQ